MGLGFVFFAQSEEECGTEKRRRRQGGAGEKERVSRRPGMERRRSVECDKLETASAGNPISRSSFLVPVAFLFLLLSPASAFGLVLLFLVLALLFILLLPPFSVALRIRATAAAARR